MVNVATPTIDIYVATDGNVGIGTTVPTAALDVSGNLKVSGTMFGGNIQTGVLSPPNWGYSSTSASMIIPQ